MDFDFSRFNTRSFERFSQALVVHYLGAGINVYGDGPDGAREASYSGKLAFPSESDGWDGYTVVQAKFRQASGGAASDASWLVRELKSELSKFLEEDRELEKPDFYLLVTNAKLSSIPKTQKRRGGIEKVNEVFKELGSKIGIKDFKVWHLDELNTRLMNCAEIRQSHAAWITPSDVLSNVMRDLSLSRSDFDATMHRFLLRELREQRSTRMQQAGHSTDAPVNLEDVFVDLPFSLQGSSTEKHEMLLGKLLQSCCEPLRQSTLSRIISLDKPRPDRFLLFGGPGQGKSTISQFFAQFLRAQILNAEEKRSLSVDVAGGVRSILDYMKSNHEDVKVPLRFPIRIELPLFADALSQECEKGQEYSLLDYIRDYIGKVAHQPDLPLGDLRRWMSAYPIVLLLDGLDEVPPSANRAETIDAINEFWDEAAAENADVLMVVTTRPQGYNDDLSPNLYTQLHMSSLSPEHAMNYAKKLAENRLPDPNHRARVLERLQEAAKSPTTSRLLISPLQVAIMLALIDQKGEAPSDRWTLFDKYFNVVLEREQQKIGEGGQIVKKWSRMICGLHYSVGFFLHLKAEGNGNSGSHISRQKLRDLVTHQLSREGYEGEELENSVNELLNVTTDRLILLVQNIDQYYSFEVRSLQEFMAAAYMMSGPQVVVQDRLREISNKSHWRHVFLIASSKCFSSHDSFHFRDTIINICREMNDGERIDAELMYGSHLALELLKDGLAYDQPIWRRHLLSVALDIRMLSGEDEALYLARSIESEFDKLKEKIVSKLNSKYFSVKMAAWSIVLNGSSERLSWAESVLRDNWPSELIDRIRLVFIGVSPENNNCLLYNLFEDAISDAGPELCFDVCRDEGVGSARRLSGLLEAFPCLKAIQSTRVSVDGLISISLLRTPVSTEVVSVKPSKVHAGYYQTIPSSESWSALRAVRVFHENPSSKSLAEALRKLDDHGWHNIGSALYAKMPWPLLTILKEYSPGNLPVEEVAAGEFGDLDDWLMAEKRWSTFGIQPSDAEVLESGYSFDSRVATCGMPWWHMISITYGRDYDRSDWFASLIGFVSKSINPARRFLCHISEFAASTYLVEPLLEEGDLLSGVLASACDVVAEKWWLNPELLLSCSDDALASERVCRLLSDRGATGQVSKARGEWGEGKRNEIVQLLSKKANAFPGLIVIIMVLLLEEDMKIPQDILNIAEDYIDHENIYISSASELILAFNGWCMVNTCSNMILFDDKSGIRGRFLIQALINDKFDVNETMRLLIMILNIDQSGSPSPYINVLRKLSSLADSRRSNMADENCVQKLQLRSELCEH